jgi:hypothetical protein
VRIGSYLGLALSALVLLSGAPTSNLWMVEEFLCSGGGDKIKP